MLVLVCSSAAHADDFKTHHDLALALYQAQKFDESIPEFKAAYAITPKSGLLFNLAQAYRKAGHPREAIEYYDRYLSTSPQVDDDTRHKVDGYLTEARNTLAALELEMKQRLAEEKAAHEPEPSLVPVVAAPPPPVVPPVVPPPPKPVYKRWWLWTIVGGAVLAGTAVGLGVGLSNTGSPYPRATVVFK